MYCPANSSVGAQCPNGTYCSTPATSVQCPANSYCVPGATAPTPCASSLISAAGSTDVSQCQTAYVNINITINGVSSDLNQSQFQGALPSNVVLSTYQDELVVTPGDCPRGYYCPANTVSPIPCPAGKFNNNTNMVSLDACVVCFYGGYCPEASVVPTACPPGTYNPATGATNPSVCITCPAGNYCPKASFETQACLPGTYRATPNATSADDCLPCPPGQYCGGRTVTPINCSAGTYRGTPGATVGTDCANCPAGNYCPPGSVNPTNCTPGTYMDVTRAAACFDCLVASYCPVASVNPTPCPQGTHRNITGGANVSDCFVCPAGTICIHMGGNTNPELCFVGNYNPTPGGLGCLVCPGGTYCPTSGMAIPTNCTPGTYSSTTEAFLSSVCVSCITGNYCPSGSVNPTNCSAGTYNSLTGQGSVASCLSCPVGQFCLQATTTPSDCAAGSYRGTTGAESQAQCTTCPSGNYCPVKSVNPTNCTAGTYNMYTGKTSKADCLACPQGNACPTATSTPQVCAVDTFALASADVCSACPAFSSSPAQSANCTCRGGHTQKVEAGGGGAPAAVSYTVVGTDDYRSQGMLQPGQLNYLTIDGYANLTVLKGTVLTLTLAPFNSVQSNLRLYFNPPMSRFGRDDFFDENPDNHFIIDNVNYFTAALTTASIVATIYTTGVTGSGTSTLVFDTSQATLGNYHLASDGVISRRVLTIQVQSPTPATVTIPPASYRAFFVTYGDTYIVNQYNLGVNPVIIMCRRNTDLDWSLATLVTSGSTPLTWDTSTLSTDMQCFLTDPGIGAQQINLFFKPRLSSGGGASVLTCSNCSAGYRSSPGDTACTECGLGYYSPPVSASCTICPQGTKCNSTTTPEPIPCGLGYYSPPASASCTICPLGTMCNSTTTLEPIPCGLGFYQPSTGASTCLPCPVGQYCPSATTSTPVDCAAGSYRGTTGATAQGDCTVCPSGNYCPVKSVDPTNCSAGTYNSLTGQGSVASCLSCPVGQYCLQATTTPSDCAAGSYRGTTGATAQGDCTVCPSGNYCPVKSVDPTNCSAGTYNPYTAQGSSSSCLTCPQGDYCPVATSTPSQCAANTFALAGAAVCSACPAFSTSPVRSRNCTCDAGHTQTVVTSGGGSTAAKSYTVVGVSSYQQIGMLEVLFQPPVIAALTINGYTNLTVPKGTVLTLTSAPFGGSQFNMRIYSGFNEYAAFNMQKVNRQVLEPSYSGIEVVDFLTVSFSDPDSYTVGVSGSNTPTIVWDTSNANAGVYYLGTPSGRSLTTMHTYLIIFVVSPTPTIITYPARTMSFVGVMAAHGDVVRIFPPKQEGSFFLWCIPRNNPTAQPEMYGRANSWDTFLEVNTALINPATTHCYMSDGLASRSFGALFIHPRLLIESAPAVSTLTCPNCSAGYRSSAGDAACTECGLGYYSPPVSSACTICPVGTKCNSTTTPDAIPCGAGNFQPDIGQFFCNVCPLGKYCPLSATANPTDCVAGTYNPSPGGASEAACLACAIGKFSTVVGSHVDCLLCLANFYCKNPTSSAPCPEHTTSAAGSSSLLHCQCVSGFRCAYTKKITAVVTLNTTLSNFESDTGGVRTAFKSAVAAAAGVTPDQVTINNVAPKTGRRLLGATALIEVRASVHGAERLHRLDAHLGRHSATLHQGHVWDEAHSLVTTPLFQRHIRPMRHAS